MKVRIKWIGKSQNQIDGIIKVNRYTTVVRFAEESEEQWRKQAWSLDITDFQLEIDGYFIANICFLSADAPKKLLFANSHFGLYEGPTCTAEGIVIE